MGHIREYYERIMQLREPEGEFIAVHFDRKVFAKDHIIRWNNSKNDTARIRSHAGNPVP